MEEGMIKRTKRNINFTQIDNSLLNDKNMSLDTKGLLCYILSKPDDWIVYKRQLMKEFNIGRTMMDRMFKEMEGSGYLVVSKMLRGEDGSFKGNAYLFYDQSIFTDARKPTTVDPTTENHTTTNTILKPILNNTNISNVVLDVIELLNSLTNKKYRADEKSSNYNFISARIKDGYSVDDLKRVTESKVRQWINDSKMKEYLRPSTLFNKTNFENYINESHIVEVKKESNSVLDEIKKAWKK
jgi:uncharacterized phage protein (TIGR02220 family)